MTPTAMRWLAYGTVAMLVLVAVLTRDWRLGLIAGVALLGLLDWPKEDSRG